MSAAAKGIWSLLILIALACFLVFAIPLLVRILILLPQLGWGLVG